MKNEYSLSKEKWLGIVIMKSHSKGSQNCDDAWALTFSIALKYQT
jgi:hypothetical protein